MARNWKKKKLLRAYVRMRGILKRRIFPGTAEETVADARR